MTGPGEVYVQTKNVKEFVDWIWRYIAPRIPKARARKRLPFSELDVHREQKKLEIEHEVYSKSKPAS